MTSAQSRLFVFHDPSWGIGGIVAMELDRLHAVKADLAEENLARGFTGKLQDANCSVEADAEQILEQLRESGHEKEVEVPCNMNEC